MLRRLIIIAFLYTLAAVPGWSGNIPGALNNPRGERISNQYTVCAINGTNPTGVNSGGLRTSNDGGSYGVFYWGGLAAGTYSQGIVEVDSNGVYYRKGIVVPASGDAAWTVLQHNPSVFCWGNEYFPVWKTWVAQSFRATGTSVCSVSVRCAGVSGSAGVEVAILDGDSPSAPQIGPTRVIPYSPTWNMNARAAYWSAGEVPTVPGQVYTIRMRPTNHGSGGQFSPFRQTVRNKLREEIPDGRTWYDGVLSNERLETTVTTDDQGFIHTMCCARGDGYAWVSTHASQSFTSRGSSVLAVTWSSNSNGRFAVSVHSGSPSGTQIGPTKYINGAYSWDNRSMVTFAPGEIPTTPGNVYCVKLRLADGSGFSLDKAGASSIYSGGTAYVADTAQNYDWAMGIYEEKFSGSIDQAVVGIYSPTADTITANSAVIRWSTSIVSDSRVDYGESTPYSHTVYSSALSTSHAVTLTGLKSNTMYHVRVISNASGAREGVGKDFVFVTAAGGPNLLANPGFETGTFSSWTQYGGGDRQVRGPGWLGGAGPHSGNYGTMGAASGGLVHGGVYQRVAATPGNEYRLSGWIWTYSDANLWSRNECTMCVLGLDPMGGTNPGSNNVITPGIEERWYHNPNCVWTADTMSQNGGPNILYGYLNGVWTNIGISAIATSNYVTAFAYGGNDRAAAWSIYAIDDLVLTSVAPVSVTIPQALTSQTDGTFVGLANVTCTDASQPGVNYVQAGSKTAGIRVESKNPAGLDERVSVSGYLATKPSGERYLANAVYYSRTAGTGFTAISLRLSSVGGKSIGPYCASVPNTNGPYNVGMLVQTCGEVKARGTGCFYINDGSLPGNGLKVDSSSLTVMPNVGDTVGITGTVQLEGASGSATVLLHPRMDSDVRVYL